MSFTQEELDRQAQLVQQLTAQNDDLVVTVETLKAEVLASNEEAERASRELETLRSRALHDSSQETFLRERELRELQAELEQCRIERDEWEQKALQEHISADEARTTVDALRRDLEVERDARQRAETNLEVEREKSGNLQSVLEDFQQCGCSIALHYCCSLTMQQPRITISNKRSRTMSPNYFRSRNHWQSTRAEH